MRTLFFVAWLAVAAATPAISQILDSQPDVIAFYADPVGNRAGVCTYFMPQTLYLMITHPSDDTGLTGYGCSFALTPGVLSLGFSPGDGIIIQDTFPILDIALPTPRPTVGDTYTLGSWTMILTSTTPDIVTLIDHFPGLPAEAAYMTVGGGQALIPVSPPDWGNGMPMGDPWWHAVLWLNVPQWCGVVTAPEGTSWGSVKALFR